MSGAFSVAVFFLLKPRRGTRTEPLQVPEDPVWLSTLVTCRSRIVALLLKLAYNDCSLKFSRKEGWDLHRRKRRSGQTAYRSR